jgi:hypothetical protein
VQCWAGPYGGHEREREAWGRPSRYLAERSGSECLGAATSARGRRRPNDAAASVPAPCREEAGSPPAARGLAETG